MDCLPFIRKVANLRSLASDSSIALNKKAFLSENRKPRNSTDSGFSSANSSGRLSASSRSTRSSVSTQSTADSADLSSTLSSERESTVTSGYAHHMERESTVTSGYAHHMEQYNQRRQPNSYFEQMSRSCDESTVFSMSSEMDIVISLADAEDYLGISIVGQNYTDGDSSLFVGAVLPGGAVNRDGRIQPGDLILAVNGQSLDGRTNKEAVTMLRQAVRAYREVTLTIVGSWDEESVYSDGTCVRPIDPLLWLAHNSLIHQSDEVGLTEPPKQRYTKSQTSIVSSSLSSSMPSTAARYRLRFQQQALPLETPTDIIANRLRLHIIARNNSRQQQQTQLNEGGSQGRTTISINGVELQMWLYRNVRGFKDLPEVENYATHMISCNYLIPASSYLMSGGHNYSNQHGLEFSRRENYIVNTRPVSTGTRCITPVRSMTPVSCMTSVRSTTPAPHKLGRSRSSTPLSACEEVPVDSLQLLQNQLSSTGLSVSRF